MNKLLLALVMSIGLCAGSASAKPVAVATSSDGTAAVILTDDACHMQGAPAEAHQMIFKAKDKPPLKGCWTQQEDKIFILDDDGDAGFMPASAFSKVKNV